MKQTGLNVANVAQTEDDDVVDIAHVVATIWRGKWFVALIMALCGAVALIYVQFVAVPLFSSTSYLRLEVSDQNFLDIQSVVSGFTGDDAELNTELEVLRSRSLLEEVVVSQNLVEYAEFNQDLREPGIFASLTARFFPASGDVVEKSDDDLRRAAVEHLLSKLSVGNTPNTYVIRVTVKSESAERSAQLADAVVAAFIDHQLARKFDETESASRWLSVRVSELKAELEGAEAQLARFSTSSSVLNREAIEAKEVQIKDLRVRVSTSDASKTIADRRLDRLKAAEADSYAAKAVAADDARLRELVERMQAGGSLSQRAAFDSRYAQIVAQAQVAAGRSASQLRTLRASLAVLEQEVETISGDLITFQQLSREADASRLLYEHFLGRLKETSAQEGIHQADSYMLSPAVVPYFASEPRKKMAVILALILGLIAGAAFVLIRDARRKTFMNVEEAERFAGLPVLGSLPKISTSGRTSVLDDIAGPGCSATQETLRNLRTTVLFANAAETGRVVMLTSSLPEEGKSTIANALARQFGELDKKILLIEADIRKPSFYHGVFEGNTAGVVDVLTGATALKDAVFRIPGQNVDVLVSQSFSTSPANLLSSERVDAMMEDARKAYDLIVLDTPPVLLVPDARILSRFADTILFVVRWNATTKTQVQDALDMFAKIGKRANGLILNSVKGDAVGSYRYGKYGRYFDK